MKKKMEKITIQMNSRKEDLKLAKRLLKEYVAKGDKENIAICKRNIKNFSK